MSAPFWVQLVASFLVGGALVTILSLIAERAGHRIAGIIMMFPTTLVLGFFFLGYTTSAQHVSNSIPAALIPLGIIVFSAIIYIYCALFFESRLQGKIPQIAFSFLTCIVLWFLVVSPFAIFKFSNVFLGAAGFFVLIVAAQLILKKSYTLNFPRPQYTKIQILIRASFTGSTITTVVILSKTLGSIWGGIFTMFPAATLSSLIILHYYYSPRQLFYFMSSVPLGSLSLFVYTIAVMLLFPKIGIWAGSLISYGISLAFGFCLIKFRDKKIT